MRLLIKTSLVYMVITLAVFVVGSTITYNIFERSIVRETDGYLIEKYFAAVNGLKAGEPASAYAGQIKDPKHGVNVQNVVDSRSLLSLQF